MSSLVEELFPTQDIIDYTTSIGLRQYPLEALFPQRKVMTDDIKVISDTNDLPEIAHIHADDTEAELAARSGEVTTVNPYLIKRKYQLTEKDLRALAAPRSDDEKRYIMGHIFADVKNLADSIGATLELMRVKALTEKNFTIGVAHTGADNAQKFDYNLPASSQLDTVDFSDASVDPIEVLMAWVDNADFDVTHALTSKKAFSAIRNNPNVIKRIYGVNNLMATLSGVMPADFDRYMESNNLPQIAAYSGKYTEKGVTKQFMSDGRMALFAGDTVGNTVFGQTAEEAAAILNGQIQSTSVNNIMYQSYAETKDPIASIVKASAIAIPTLGIRNQLLQATVLK